jgi:hypothetical protein
MTDEQKKVADRLALWFMRNLTSFERAALFRVQGLSVEDTNLDHQKAFARILDNLSTPSNEGAGS